MCCGLGCFLRDMFPTVTEWKEAGKEREGGRVREGEGGCYDK